VHFFAVLYYSLAITEREVFMSEWQQLMNERAQMTEEALIRAEKGIATQEDWLVIWSECGLRTRRPLIPMRKEAEDVFNCER
jgi:hypothetical protein